MMKKISGLLYFFLVVLESSAQFIYISPLPGSEYHNPETNIILRATDFVDSHSLLAEAVTISGSVSGCHSCNIILSDDQKTILIYPAVPFSEGDTVSVQVSDQFRKNNGEIIQGVSFQFSIHPKRTSVQLNQMREVRRQLFMEEFGFDPQLETDERVDCLGLPSFDILVNESNAFQGEVFYYNYNLTGAPNGNWYRTIISNEGDSIWANCNDEIGVGWTINHDGHLTGYNVSDSIENCFSVFDSGYQLIATYCAGNGFMADAHEFRIYPDRHAFLQCDDMQYVDMTPYGSTYDSAMVIGTCLQELDANQNVVFQWRSWDHFQITDAVTSVCITCSTVDYVHANSIDLDSDGNILLLCRHMNEITKINRTTGEIIWRLGGENNMFTFVNDDPTPFGMPHDIRRLPNDYYSLYDNAYTTIPHRSRAKVYHLDQASLVATMAWKYEHPDINGHPVYGSGLGNVQLLPNGNYFICWGKVDNIIAPFPNFTEVDTAGNIVWEMRFTSTPFYYCYRAFKFDWDPWGTSAALINEQETPLEIFPNPAAENFTIRFFSEGNSEARIRISNLQGQIIWEGLLMTTSGENTFSPPVQYPSEGIYFVSLTFGQSSGTERMVIVR